MDATEKKGGTITRVRLVIERDGEEGVQEVEMPVSHGKDGRAFMDVSGLNKHAGIFTFDPGFMGTASCSSSISLIDGQEGKLLFRGYRIEDLAEHSNFREVTFLLLHGYLPSEAEMDQFEWNVSHHTLVHEKLRSFYQGFTANSHPMSILCGVMGAMSSFYHDSFEIYDRRAREQAAYRIVGKMPTIAAMAYKYSIGEPFVYPRADLTCAENLLRMLFAVPSEDFVVDPVLARAMDTVLLLHADHGQNASTSTARIAASSHANPFACIAAAIASLWGPAHGGANEAVLKMLHEIGTEDRIPIFLARAKDKSDPFRLFGFGHRVYKKVDPRAKIMRRVCHEVLEAVRARNLAGNLAGNRRACGGGRGGGGGGDKILSLAMALERAASADEYFIQRGLYANVDFYSGIVFRAIGIPESMFTVMFAVGRSIGWVANWLEMMDDPKATKIARPRQRYDGFLERSYVPISERELKGEGGSRRKLSLI